jgi:hypothetical protein
MDIKVVEKIFEGMGIPEKLQSKELHEQVSAILEEIVKNRVEAMTHEFTEKEKMLLEKAEAAAKDLKSKEDILAEEAKQFARELQEEMAQKEAIMLEEIAAFNSEVEKTVLEEASLFREEVEKAVLEEAIEHRTAVESILLEEVENYKKFLEGVVTEEATSYIAEQEQHLAKEVSAFKESMVKKVGEYFEAELPKRIPKNIMEAAVKLSAYEPLIEGIIGTFSKNYVKLDSQSLDIIKESKTKIEELSESLSAKIKDSVNLQAKNNDLERKLKITELVEGMTVAAKGKTVALLESCSTVEEITNKFNQIKDIVITESVVAAKPVTKTEKPPVVLSESNKKKVEILAKGAINKTKDPEMAQWERKLNEQLITG